MSTSAIHDGGFAVTTHLAASPRVLYDAWTTKEGLEGWLATTALVDARANGTYVLTWPAPDGELSARGEYLELVPGERIAFTWESWGPAGRIEDGDANVRVTFTDLGNGTTEMVQTEWGPSYTDRTKIDMNIAGTIQAHEALARFVQPGKA